MRGIARPSVLVGAFLGVVLAAASGCRSTERTGVEGDCRPQASVASTSPSASTAGVGRTKDGAVSAASPAPDGMLVDPPLLAFLSKARAVHLRADLAEDEGDKAEAVRLLDELVRSQVPGGESPGPEVREVLADTLARIAELESALERDDAARDRVKRGLAFAREPSHFRGRLFEVLGAVEKRAYDRLRKGGDVAGARSAKERSLAALKEAMAIQEAVIEGALGGER